MGMLGKSWKVGGDADWGDPPRLSEAAAREIKRQLDENCQGGCAGFPECDKCAAALKRIRNGPWSEVRRGFEHATQEEYEAAIESTRDIDVDKAVHPVTVEEPPHFDKLRMKP